MVNNSAFSVVGFNAESLPLPCAFLRLPWPRGKQFSRLLPAREDGPPSTCTFRQFVKRMIVEEICSSPPYYLLRYTHYTRTRCEEPADLKKTRLAQFFLCRRALPALQALSIQRSFSRRGAIRTDTGLQVKVFEHPMASEELLVVYTEYAHTSSSYPH